jgi:hypothetical protein
MEQNKTTGKQGNEGIALSRLNIIILLVGMAFVIIGFTLMAGGASDDPQKFNPDVFSQTRITVAPILVLLGFAINIAAIMLKPKKG